MHITRSKSSINDVYNIDNVNLDAVNKFEYLGIILTDDLKWNEHIQYITSKCKKLNGFC